MLAWRLVIINTTIISIPIYDGVVIGLVLDILEGEQRKAKVVWQISPDELYTFHLLYISL